MVTLPGAGERAWRVEIQAPQVLARTTSGQPTVSWLPVATVWAKKEQLKGEERMLAEQLASHVDTRWTIPWRSDITPENRLRDLADPVVMEELPGRLYDIVGVLEVGRREALQLLARARSEAS